MNQIIFSILLVLPIIFVFSFIVHFTAKSIFKGSNFLFKNNFIKKHYLIISLFFIILTAILFPYMVDLILYLFSNKIIELIAVAIIGMIFLSIQLIFSLFLINNIFEKMK